MFPTLRLRRPHDRGHHARHAEGEAERTADGFLEIAVLQEFVAQFLQPLPVALVLGIVWFMAGLPGDIGDGAFRDHGHLFLLRVRDRVLDRFLVGDVQPGIERAA